MNKKQIALRLLFLIAILILVNLVSLRFFTRVDMTKERLYTLSDASRNLMKGLDDKFLVKAYFTSDLPSPYNNNRREVQDQLDEYRAYAHGNFQYEFIDPGKKEDLEQEAQRYGVPPVRVQVLKEDKLQIEKAYMGLVFLYGDKQERLPVVQSTSNLEYEITSAVKKMTAKELKKIGFLTGQGEPGIQQISQVQEMLTKQYDVTTVDLTGGKPVPQDIAALVIAAPTQKFRNYEKFLIDQYLMKGGHIAFFLNKVNATLDNQMAQPSPIEIDDMLEAYGLRINSDLVRDASCAYVTVNQRAGFMVIQNQIPYYFLPRASSFNQTSPVVRDLGSVVFYFISSIDTTLARSKGLSTTVLVKSSNKSGRQENTFVLDPTQPATPEQFKETGIPLAVAVEGAFPSAFANRPVGIDSIARGAIDTSGRLYNGKLSKIVVVGDGDFLQDQLSGGNKDNFLLATNIIDWLADDAGLSAIRSRETSTRPLDEVGEATKAWVKGINLVIPPFIVILIGVIRWRWRIATRKRLETRGL
jgi:gliding-associated putative ABC transporter substrate-binding component GldG